MDIIDRVLLALLLFIFIVLVNIKFQFYSYILYFGLFFIFLLLVLLSIYNCLATLFMSIFIVLTLVYWTSFLLYLLIIFHVTFVKAIQQLFIKLITIKLFIFMLFTVLLFDIIFPILLWTIILPTYMLNLIPTSTPTVWLPSISIFYVTLYIKLVILSSWSVPIEPKPRDLPHAIPTHLIPIHTVRVDGASYYTLHGIVINYRCLATTLDLMLGEIRT